jgi:hypothetical protein
MVGSVFPRHGHRGWPFNTVVRRQPMTLRFKLTFAALLLAQAAHSVEEYVGRFWDSFPPARFLTGLVSQDRERSFVALTILLMTFGLWCLIWPVRREWPSAVYLAWAWVIVEVINGIVHSFWTLREGGYTPGVATAPLLLVLAVYLGYQLRNERRNRSAGA